MKKKVLFIGMLLFTAFILLYIAVQFNKTVNSRLSCIVSFVKDKGSTHEFLESPQQAFMEAYVRFPGTLGEDVVFGIDQEFVEGTSKPIFYSGGDWMTFTGLQRNGTIWISVGTENTMKGIPSKQRTWKILKLDVPLKPDTWYRLRNVADFGTRKFVNFSIEGPGISRTFDLSSYYLDYPNAIPFNQRAMTYFVWTMRGKNLGGNLKTGAFAYFDNIRAGYIDKTGTESVIFENGFEKDRNIFLKQPIEFINKQIPLEKYKEDIWYLEREESRSRPFEADFAKSGKQVAICDATIENINYQHWVKRIF